MVVAETGVAGQAAVEMAAVGVAGVALEGVALAAANQEATATGCRELMRVDVVVWTEMDTSAEVSQEMGP